MKKTLLLSINVVLSIGIVILLIMYFFNLKITIGTGISMQPTISYYSIGIVKICDSEEIKENDIVSYISKSGEENQISMVNHRVLKKVNDDCFFVKGDNPTSLEEYISKNQIIGKIIYVINYPFPFIPKGGEVL